MLNRRQFGLGVAASALAPLAARANVPSPYDWGASPPTTSRQAFVDWMVKFRGENADFLGQRFDRYQRLVQMKDLWDAPTTRAYLLTPREEFVTKDNVSRAYDGHFLNIGYGVTITGPHSVCRMTDTLQVKPTDKVLEIGTGSGYQSAVLSNLTAHLSTIEIIEPLYKRTRALYDKLIADGYSEYSAIKTKNADGYYGWAEEGPFDKIIVTCGIDHVPPPLLQQMKPDGIMVIPVGPPGAQHVLKVTKQANADGTFTATRTDIYGGAIIPFVPFTGGHQGA